MSTADAGETNIAGGPLGSAPLDLKGTSTLVLGGAGGIGSALVRRLAARGSHVVVAGRTAEKVQALATEVRGTPVPLDATDFDQVADAVATAREAGEFVGAANCVGSILLKPAQMTSADELWETLRLNLGTAFALVRSAGPALARNGGGSIALVSSTAARIGLPNHEAIAAAKGAVEGLVRSAASSFSRRRVRVNAVAPGLVDTPMAASLTGNEKRLEASKAMHPLGRIGEPDEVARVLEWLVGPESGWVTGTILPLDGGISTVKPG